MNLTSSNNYKGNILIVDDTIANLRLLVNLLRENGYKVRPVTDGNLALEAIQEKHPDLILLDIIMPDLSGYEICQTLKANPKTREIPVIFLSGLSEGLDKSKAFQIGGEDYITKPFQVEEVLARVALQLTRRSLQVQLQQKNQLLSQQNAQLQLLLKATQAINSAPNLDAALEKILALVCQTIGWDLGEAWVVNSDRFVLERSWGWYANEGKLEEFHLFSKTLIFRRNEGMPGRIWATKQPEWVQDISQQEVQVFPRCHLAAAVGLKAAFGVPILFDNQVLAILIFFSKKNSTPEDRSLELVNAIATQLGSFVERKQAETALFAANQKLALLATLDELTGVANRRYFNEHLAREWSRLKREQIPLSLILCDIDYFKRYNDYYGHLAGDVTLKQVAQAIRKVLKRPADLVARYGGEEFVILLPNTSMAGAVQVGELIRQQVQQLKIPHAQSLVSDYVTLSLGISSLVPSLKESPEVLIKMADEALYAAKRQGRNIAVARQAVLD
ncbi:diguanylate cyclase domain-containing protein [Microseira sp. BLCC-F43]|jgi:diguanylate cyclase (GGDEF)-like protein|uniref:GGDEF domain-containing response regulator n=1 Tax=Microseira sp. BLCC-F43 TaxID=3153602 RepID=UPI0035B8E05D